jgi:hypothetical protein
LAELDSVTAYIPSAAEDDDSLAFSHAGVVKQHLPSSATDDRNRSGFGVAKPSWLHCDHPRVDEGIFRISAGKPRIGDAENLFARSKTHHARTDLLNRAGQIRAQGEGQWLRQDAFALPDPGVPRADARGGDTDQDLPRPRSRVREVFVDHGVDAAERMHADRLHHRTSRSFQGRRAAAPDGRL